MIRGEARALSFIRRYLQECPIDSIELDKLNGANKDAFSQGAATVQNSPVRLGIERRHLELMFWHVRYTSYQGSRRCRRLLRR